MRTGVGILTLLPMLLATIISGFATGAHAASLVPIRVAGYFNWAAANDGTTNPFIDSATRQRDDFPEIVTLGSVRHLVRIVTRNGRPELRLTPLKSLLASDRQRLFPEMSAFGLDTGKRSSQDTFLGAELPGSSKKSGPILVRSFGRGLFQARQVAEPGGRTCDVGLVALEPTASAEGGAVSKARVRLVSCDAVIGAVALDKRTTDVLTVSASEVRVITTGPGAARVSERMSLASWLPDVGAPSAIAGQVVGDGTVVTVAAAASDGKPIVCVVTLGGPKGGKRILDRRPTECPRVANALGANAIVSSLAISPDGRQLAIVGTDRRTKRSGLVLLDLDSRAARRIADDVQVADVVSVPYVYPVAVQWLGADLFWLSKRGGGRTIVRYSNNRRAELVMREREPCTKVEDVTLEDDVGLWSQIVGRRLGDAFSDERKRLAANWFMARPAWLQVVCSDTSDLIEPVDAVRFVDVGWFVPFRAPSGKLMIAAATVVQVTMIAFDASAMPPPVSRMAIFEVR
ncbi:MAG: hypothetical protein AAFY53_05375 [Pseudomonadota bacterium]